MRPRIGGDPASLRIPEIPVRHAADGGLHDGPHTRGFVGPLCFKAAKIVSAQQIGQSLLHQADIEPLPQSGHFALQKRRGHVAVVQQIAIAFAEGRKRGMKVGMHFPRLNDGHVRRQKTLQSATKLTGGNP